MSSSDGPALVVQGGVLDGTSLPVRGPEGERLLGSGPAAHLRLAAANVEEQHAKVLWNDEGITVENLSRERGTFVNGERVEQAMEIGHGDRVCLGPPGEPGSVKLLVHLPGPPGDYPAEAVEPPAASMPEEGWGAGTGPSADAVAAAQSEEWGAVDDDEEVIKAEKGRTLTGGIPGGTPTTTRGSSAAAHPPPLPLKAPPPPKGRTAGVPAAAPKAAPRAKRAPIPRSAVLGVGALLLAGGGYLTYARATSVPPVLGSLTPPKAEPGSTIQINGSGFSGTPSRNRVTIADKPAEVIAAGASQLSVMVPKDLPPDDARQHDVRVETSGGSSNKLPFRVYVAPKVTSLEPDVAMPGEEVKVVGEHFGEDTVILVGGKPARVLEATDKTLRFKVPADLTLTQGKALPVAVQVGKNAARSSSLLIGQLPLVLEVAPKHGAPGDRVTIKGRGFDPAVGGTVVTFNDRPALVLGASATELTLIVPAVPASGQREASLAVRALGSSSAGPPFAVVRPSAAQFLPRFVPEPGPDRETVVVGSDLGPFLRLRGKGEAPSVAERASQVAAALNAAIEQASRGAVTVELREKGDPAVALAGVEQPIVTATPADSQAYDSRPAPRTLARYWTALLQDYIALFAQRQRPFRVLELSPRGQALQELFVAAERRAGSGAGVPRSIVEGLSPSQSRALSEMALGVASQAPTAAAGAAVAGRWSGTFEETGKATRAIHVRIESAKGALQGSLGTTSGSIAAELPLSEVSYKNGVLSFRVLLGLNALRFSGQVEGREIAGQVQSAEAKPVGRFSLRWVE